MTRRASDAGITLIEMLVALALFALVGLASFAVLDTVIRTRDRTQGRLEELATLDRALGLFGRDLGQSDAGSVTLGEGGLGFSLAGAGGPAAMGYALAEGTLERRAGEDVAQRLVVGVAGASFRVLDREGAWHEAWPPEGAGSEAPVASGVEMVLMMPGEGEEAPTLRRLVELPLGIDPGATGPFVPETEAALPDAEAPLPETPGDAPAEAPEEPAP